MRLATLFFLTASPVVALLANAHRAHVGPIVLFGALAVGTPVGLLLGRAMQRGLEEEFAARYRRSEGAFFLTAAVSQVGMLVRGQGVVGMLAIAVSACAILAACWLLLKAAPAGAGRAARALAPNEGRPSVG